MSEDRWTVAMVYCGQCGQLVESENAKTCPGCLMTTCREFHEQVEKCWYCGQEWQVGSLD